jgi:deoxyribonuclease V
MDNLNRFLEICRTRDIKEAIQFQKSLTRYFDAKTTSNVVASVGAFDISYDKFTKTNFAASVIMSFPHLEIIEKQSLVEKARFPYIPGLLAFREGPSIIKLYHKLEHRPDLLLIDGHGLAHPRRMGIATMIGILLEMPVIGCAKSRLVGEFEDLGPSKGDYSELIFNGQKVGYVLRSRTGVKPIFVSVGSHIVLPRASEIVLACCRKYRLPEPIREAHKLANEVRSKYGPGKF